MTKTTRSIFQSSILTLTACFSLSACVSAGTAGKNAPPNSSSDATESAFPQSAPAETQQGTSEFAQAPAGDDMPAPVPEGESATDKSAPAPAGEYRRSAPSYGDVPKAGGLAQAPQSSPAKPAARAPMASADQTIASNGSRSRVQEKSSAPMRRQEERPGLATLWGETRKSWVTTTTFTRSSSQPWSLLRIQYDDESGILSRTGRSSYAELGSNIVETPSGFVTVQVIDDSGNPLTGLTQGSRSFVVGHQGDRYCIRVTNHSHERFEIVATVDGLDVIDGRPGSFTKRGYLIDADSSLDIDGFRRSSSEVAAFRFGSVKDSYAARTSGDRNVGVIGVAVFREYHAVYDNRWDENRRRDNADPFPNRFAAPPPPPPVPMIRN